MNTFKFDDLLGNVTTIGLLRRSIANKSFKQFTIFSGVMGTGKSTSAKCAAMALTCEHPDNGQACMQCPSCRANLHALTTNGESANVKIINVADLLSRDDINTLLHNVFDLESSIGNQVYIFEEAHALKNVRGSQVAFLPEIDRMPLNTYIVMCTTRSTDLEPELRSRALEFQFRRLNENECNALLKKTLLDKGYRNLPDKVAQLLVHNCRGIPRDLLNALDFVIENTVTEEELLNFFQIVEDETFIQLFASMVDTDMSLMISQLDALLDDRQPAVVLTALKSFVLRCIFLLEGGVSESFSRDAKTTIKQMLTTTKLMRMADVLDKMPRGVSSVDLQLTMLKLRTIVSERSVKDIVAGREKVGITEQKMVSKQAIENKQVDTFAGTGRLSALNLQSLSSFGG